MKAEFKILSRGTPGATEYIFKRKVGSEKWAWFAYKIRGIWWLYSSPEPLLTEEELGSHFGQRTLRRFQEAESFFKSEDLFIELL